MRIRLISALGVGVLSALSFVFTGTAAAQGQKMDQVVFKNGVVHAEQKGLLVPLEAEVELSPTIQVQTNGTFTVKGGKPRPLKEGQVLRKDGYLLNPNGNMAPVFDRVVMERGNVVVVYKDGVGASLAKPITLPNKWSVSPDGTMTLPNGAFSRMIEGQMVELDGAPIPAKDTVTLINGQVVIQKEGGQLKLARGQTFMMNEGTKVFGTGKLVTMDGREIPLKEGEVILLQGVVKRQ